MFLLSMSGLCCTDKIPFDSEKWKNWVETEWEPDLRWQMRRNLIRKYKLVGMSESEIIDLLGQPYQSTNTIFSYYLGMTGTGVNIGTLIIRFEEGYATAYELYNN